MAVSSALRPYARDGGPTTCARTIAPRAVVNRPQPRDAAELAAALAVPEGRRADRDPLRRRRRPGRAEGDQQLRNPVVDRLAEQILRGPNPVGDRVRVHAEPLSRPPRARALLEIHTQRGRQPKGVVVVACEGPELAAHEVARLVEIGRRQSGQCKVVVVRDDRAGGRPASSEIRRPASPRGGCAQSRGRRTPASRSRLVPPARAPSSTSICGKRMWDRLLVAADPPSDQLRTKRDEQPARPAELGGESAAARSSAVMSSMLSPCGGDQTTKPRWARLSE